MKIDKCHKSTKQSDSVNLRYERWLRQNELHFASSSPCCFVYNESVILTHILMLFAASSNMEPAGLSCFGQVIQAMFGQGQLQSVQMFELLWP